jgi:hypothetical protein
MTEPPSTFRDWYGPGPDPVEGQMELGAEANGAAGDPQTASPSEGVRHETKPRRRAPSVAEVVAQRLKEDR